ncbi:FSH1-domain-containing protein [Ascobolus immersus RN42]|uniref:FSH1-domain-containing protein n=1 Tax=Ascobolus immersus RN42 TaxID=1160509 RepID=A0A3N4HTD8_ASCIM|nr:FSH1-domain-containing protein [Ascobolus immersus RN42]
MLHGYTQSAPSFSIKTKVLEKHLSKYFPPTTLHYANGPIRLGWEDLPQSAPPINSDFIEPYRPPPPPEELPLAYAWWKKKGDNYVGVDETFKSLSEVLDKEGPFDGVVGFSQGAALAVALASALETSRRAKVPASWNFTTQHPPMKFAVSFSGFRAPPGVSGGEMDFLYEPRVQTPTLHYIGNADEIVTPERSQMCVNACQGARVHTFPGSHYVPSSKVYLDWMAAFIRDILAGVKIDGEEEAWEDDDDYPF